MFFIIFSVKSQCQLQGHITIENLTLEADKDDKAPEKWALVS